MKSEQYASLLEESNYIEMSSSNILDNNIRELNDRIFTVEERCGKVFNQFSQDLKYLNDYCESLKKENNELKSHITNLIELNSKLIENK